MVVTVPYVDKFWKMIDPITLAMLPKFVAVHDRSVNTFQFLQYTRKLNLRFKRLRLMIMV